MSDLRPERNFVLDMITGYPQVSAREGNLYCDESLFPLVEALPFVMRFEKFSDRMGRVTFDPRWNTEACIAELSRVLNENVPPVTYRDYRYGKTAKYMVDRLKIVLGIGYRIVAEDFTQAIQITNAKGETKRIDFPDGNGVSSLWIETEIGRAMAWAAYHDPPPAWRKEAEVVFRWFDRMKKRG